MENLKQTVDFYNEMHGYWKSWNLLVGEEFCGSRVNE